MNRRLSKDQVVDVLWMMEAHQALKHYKMKTNQWTVKAICRAHDINHQTAYNIRAKKYSYYV